MKIDRQPQDRATLFKDAEVGDVFVDSAQNVLMKVAVLDGHPNSTAWSFEGRAFVTCCDDARIMVVDATLVVR